MPVELHQPQAQGGRVPVEHHRRVRADPRARHQPLQRGGAHEAVIGVLQVGVDVPQHRAVDVPVVVGGRADVDLDHPHVRVGQVSLQPFRIDQHLRAPAPAVRIGDVFGNVAMWPSLRFGVRQ